MMIVRYGGITVLVAAAGAAAAWLFRERLGTPAAQGASLGAALAAAGAIGGMALTAWAFNRNERQFFAALVFGILGRLVSYGAILVYVALGTSIDTVAAAASLLGFYVLFQILELRFVVKGLKKETG
jgi:hypothetical protein